MQIVCPSGGVGKPLLDLKKWLNLRFLSYRDVVRLTGFNLNTFNNKINGKWVFTVPEASLLAEKLNMSADDFLAIFFPKIKKESNVTCQFFACPDDCRNCTRLDMTRFCTL